MKAVGAYIRVSTEEQAKGGISLDMQEEKIKAYCRLYDLDITILERDEGISAKDLQGRPGLNRIISMANCKKISGVVVYKIDRLFRNRIDALTTEEKMRQIGVTFHSVTEHIDTTNAIGRHVFAIIVSQAAFERELISERTRDALRHKKATGQVYGPTPYGYDADENGRLVVNLEEMSVVNLIRHLKSEKKTLQGIADTLNFREIPAKNGGEWHPSTVKNILENDIHAGQG